MVGTNEALFCAEKFEEIRKTTERIVCSGIKENAKFPNIFLLNQHEDPPHKEPDDQFDSFFHNEKRQFVKWSVATFPNIHHTFTQFAKGLVFFPNFFQNSYNG